MITLCCAPDWMTTLCKPTSTYPNLPPEPRSPSRLDVLASPRATLLINRGPATLRVLLDGVQLRPRPWRTRAVARRR